MATQAQMDRLVGKALFDKEFRDLLIEDPGKAARLLRYRLDSSQEARIRSLSAEALEQLAAEFGEATGIGKAKHPISFW
jgi:hypothetical protein